MSLTKKQSGFTLIEILITLIIVSIGLLGMASLQMNSLRSNQGAYLRSQASMLSYDMADRMRANSARAIAGDYNGFDTSGTVPADPGCMDSAAGCNEAQQSNTDMFEWASRVNGTGAGIALLPGAQGTVTRGAGNLFTILIDWTETGGDPSTAVNTTFSLNFSL